MTSLPETPLHIANWIAALVFATCAVLQYNDPDPLRWILIYGAAAATSLVYWRLRPRWLRIWLSEPSVIYPDTFMTKLGYDPAAHQPIESQDDLFDALTEAILNFDRLRRPAAARPE